MKFLKRIIILPALLVALASCTNEPIISQLVNNRTTLLLKGTYESNTPYDWKSADGNFYQDDSLAVSGLPTGVTDPISLADLSINIDIASIRIAKKGTLDPADPTDYWEYFAEKRVLFCDGNRDVNNRYLVGCVENNGNANSLDLFSEGFNYPAIDIGPGTYDHFAIYFRKFVTGPAAKYDSSDNFLENLTSIFDNRSVFGLDLATEIIQFQGTSTADPIMFPLEQTGMGLVIPDNDEPLTIEVRVFIKNNLIQYGMTYGNQTTIRQPLSFIGPADWSYNYKYDDVTEGHRLGGNIPFSVRIYEKNNVGSIDITDAQAPAANMEYYAVMPTGASFDPQAGELPYAATSVAASGGGSAGSITNLPPGTYDIYKTCDLQMQSTGGLIDRADGYPEKPVNCAVSATVTKGAATAASFDCPCQ